MPTLGAMGRYAEVGRVTKLRGFGRGLGLTQRHRDTEAGAQPPCPCDPSHGGRHPSGALAFPLLPLPATSLSMPLFLGVSPAPSHAHRTYRTQAGEPVRTP